MPAQKSHRMLPETFTESRHEAAEAHQKPNRSQIEDHMVYTELSQKPIQKLIQKLNRKLTETSQKPHRSLHRSLHRSPTEAP